jgi:RND family efflux transporter MFP subunit
MSDFASTRTADTLADPHGGPDGAARTEPAPVAPDEGLDLIAGHEAGMSPADAPPSSPLAGRVMVALAILLSSIVVFVVLVMTRPLPAAGSGRGAPIPVPVVEPPLMSLPRQWLGYGVVKPIGAANVSARVASTVVEVPARLRVGEPVAAGEVLVRLDDADYRRSVDSATQQLASLDAQLGALDVERTGLQERVKLAESDLELAREDERRVSNAAAAGAIAPREVDRARGAVLASERLLSQLRESLGMMVPRKTSLQAQQEAAASALGQARASLERCTIASPISGVLQSFSLEIGENVMPGQPVARVVDDSRVEVPITLPAAARASVKRGDRVRITSSRVPARMRGSDGSEVISAVSRIEPEDDAVSRTMTVYAEVAQSDATGIMLAPGDFAEAIVESPPDGVRTIVPRRSVRAERVLVVREGMLSSMPVKVEYAFRGEVDGMSTGDLEWLVLAEPLPAGTLVVIDGSRTYSPGALVTPLMDDEPGTAPAPAAGEPAASPASASAADAAAQESVPQ